jgi:hypothetical protein
MCSNMRPAHVTIEPRQKASPQLPARTEHLHWNTGCYPYTVRHCALGGGDQYFSQHSLKALPCFWHTVPVETQNCATYAARKHLLCLAVSTRSGRYTVRIH